MRDLHEVFANVQETGLPVATSPFGWSDLLKLYFRTIADFRKENRKALKEVFKDFVTLCGELGLLGKKMFTVDGTKIRAVNGKKKAFTAEILDNKLKYLEEQDEEERIPGMDIKPERHRSWKPTRNAAAYEHGSGTA